MVLAVSSVWTTCIKKLSSKSRDEAQWQSAQLRRNPTPHICYRAIPRIWNERRFSYRQTFLLCWFRPQATFELDVCIVYFVQHFNKKVPVLITSTSSHNMNDLYTTCCVAGYTCMKLERCSYYWLSWSSDKRFLNPKHISNWHLRLSCIFPVQNPVGFQEMFIL